jgi:hypothetical protein
MSACFILVTSEIESEYVAAGNAGDFCAGGGWLCGHSPERQRFAPGFLLAGGGKFYEG